MKNKSNTPIIILSILLTIETIVILCLMTIVIPPNKVNFYFNGVKNNSVQTIITLKIENHSSSQKSFNIEEFGLVGNNVKITAASASLISGEGNGSFVAHDKTCYVDGFGYALINLHFNQVSLHNAENLYIYYNHVKISNLKGTPDITQKL